MTEAMLDWLKRSPRETPSVAIGDRLVPIAIRRLDRARRMTLRLAPDGGEVRISMPRWGRTADAVAFAEARRDWLAQQMSTLPAAAPPLGDGSCVTLRGQPLTIAHAPHFSRRPAVQDAVLRIGGPAASLPGRVRRWLEDQARSVLADDLAHYCGRADRPVPALALSNAQRRWGSCAPDGGIRINWRLIMAPDFVRRSVVAHEVAHLVHFDHSPAFHACLGRLYEADIRAANAWLKREGRGLYVPFG